MLGNPSRDFTTRISSFYPSPSPPLRGLGARKAKKAPANPKAVDPEQGRKAAKPTTKKAVDPEQVR
jgi:hypothetical protein